MESLCTHLSPGLKLIERLKVLHFGCQNVNANLFTSAVDVYQVIFSIFGACYVTFYT